MARREPTSGGSMTSGSERPAGGREPIDWDRLHAAARRFAAVAADLDMDPDDLAQDALASLVERVDEVDVPEAYLYVVVHRHVLAHRRRSGRRRRRVAGADLGLSTAAIDDHLVELHGLLDVLHPTDRAVLYLALVEGWPTARVAELLEVTDAAVRKRLSRARRRFARAHPPGGPDAEDR